MRVLMVMLILVGPAFAQDAGVDDVLQRARAARDDAAKRGPLRVPDDEAGCFKPKGLTGAACAKGFRLCRETIRQGSCDGYGREDSTLRPEYEGEPAPTSIGVNGFRPGLPFFHEEGPDLEMLIAVSCGLGATLSVSAPVPAGETPAEARQREAAAQRQRDAEATRVKQERARCEAAQRAQFAKERKWQRCELLSLDACAAEAFLSCRGNHGQRGLVRATWSRSSRKPASDTLKLEVLER